MNEVEKLYKNAEIKQIIVAYNCHCAEGDCIYDNPHCVICHYSKPSRDYPSLTAEKQLELIKWLGKNEMLCRLESEYPHFEKFEECTAYIINYLWQDLSSEGKDEIKEILK
jgi:hypothetical protein